MKQYRHQATGEVMTVHPGQSVGDVLAASPSWAEITEAQPEPPEAEAEAEAEAKPAADLTVNEIKEILDANGIEYTARDNKPDLLALLEQIDG